MNKNQIADYIRSFGMSGYLVTEELRGVESAFDVELGHFRRHEPTTESTYFPQFEQEVRAEASTMAAHYETFYCLEKSIRKLIVDTLKEAEPAGWWSSPRIPTDIIRAADTLIQKETDSGITRRSDDPIDYTTFGQLAVIINSNWDVFGAIFTSRRAVEKVMASLNMLRGPIAHCSPMTEDEVDRLALTVKDWFRIMA
jgi:hypothetical protein